jgi:hypothetical protein
MTKNAENAPVEVAPAKYADSALVRPEALASDLGLSGKVVRAYLRATFTRPIEAKGTTWVLTGPQANATYDHFVARRSPVVPNADAS